MPTNTNLTPQDLHLWCFNHTHPLRQEVTQAAKTYLNLQEKRLLLDTQNPALKTKLEARCLLRWILCQSHYLNCDPATIKLLINEHGKPYLDPKHQLHFNLSHNKESIVVALARQPVGIDVETCRANKKLARLATKILTPQERQLWEALPHNQQMLAFYQAWTRKEALVKCAGLALLPWLKKLPLYWQPHQPHWHDLPEKIGHTNYCGFEAQLEGNQLLCGILKGAKPTHLSIYEATPFAVTWFEAIKA
jgi:phosphopantetheinyl transferase